MFMSEFNHRLQMIVENDSVVSAKFFLISILATCLVVAIHVSILPLPDKGSGAWWLREFVVGFAASAAVPFSFVQSGISQQRESTNLARGRQPLKTPSVTPGSPHPLVGDVYVFGALLCIGHVLHSRRNPTWEVITNLPGLYRHGGV